MAFSRTTLVHRIRRILNDNPFQDTCTEAMDTTETGLDVADTTKYDIGAIVEFQDDGEQCLVTALASGTTLTVIRGYNSTTPGTGSSHSISCVIAKDPVFQWVQIQEDIESVLRGLWPYVYKEVNLTLTPNTDGNQYYNVTNGDTIPLMGLSSVTQIVGTGATSRVFRYGERKGAYPVRIFSNMPTSKVASGQALWIPYLADATNSIFVNGIGNITATYSAPNYSDISEGVQVDAVKFLTVALLVAGSDIARTTQEDVMMGDQTVVPGRRTDVSSFWERKGIQARNQWAMELQRTLPRMGESYATKAGRARP